MLKRRCKRFDWDGASRSARVPGMTETAARTAPWASDRARRRLHDVEEALPEDPAAALAAAAEAVADHERLVERDALMLYAGGNVPSASVTNAHHTLLSNQPSM